MSLGAALARPRLHESQSRDKQASRNSSSSSSSSRCCRSCRSSTCCTCSALGVVQVLLASNFLIGASSSSSGTGSISSGCPTHTAATSATARPMSRLLAGDIGAVSKLFGF